ncbi:uncharacterized protein [Argopecten irradians]|uniref:uncharacterized protein n=1 Tax=Argopecten irradians TaxID=31199 RepID=UPI00371BE5FD
MAVSVTNIGVWMLFILGSGNLIIADNVEHRLGWLEELAAKVETTVDTNIDQLGKIDQRLHRLQHGATQEKVKLRRATDPVIGFDTQLHLRAAGSHLHNQQALIFNHVRTNQGGAYNAANDSLESLASTVDAIAVANGEELKTTEDNMDEKMKQYHKEIMSINRRASHHNQIGFYVRLTNSSSGADHVTKVQPVKFDFVITNQGGGYNEAHGKFTCPVNGLYQFATTIPSAARAIIDCGLVKNDHLLARLHGNTKGYDQASQVLVIECAAGDKVWVRHLHGTHDSGRISTHYEWATFSGHLIAAL